MTAADESWAHMARATREALALVGHPIHPPCLPDEPDACGGTWAQHACAHLATLSAVAVHEMEHHLEDGTGRWEAMFAEIYDAAHEEIKERCRLEGRS